MHPFPGVGIDHPRQVAPDRRRLRPAQAGLEVDLARAVRAWPVAPGCGAGGIGIVELDAVERQLQPPIAALPAALGAQAVEVEAAGIEHHRQIEVHAAAGQAETPAIRVAIDAPRQAAQPGPALAREQADAVEARRERPVARRPRLAAPRQAHFLHAATGLEAGQPCAHAFLQRQVAREHRERREIEPVRAHGAAGDRPIGRLLEPEFEVGGRHREAVGQAKRQSARAQPAAGRVPRQREAARQVRDPQLGQGLGETGADPVEREIRGQRQRAFLLRIQPGTQPAVPRERQRVVQPGLPAAQVGALELQVQAADRRPGTPQVGEPQPASQLPAHAQRGGQRLRRPGVERDPQRAAAAIDAEGHVLECQRGCGTQLVLPYQAGAMDRDLALGEQPVEPAALPALGCRQRNAGHEDLPRRVATQHQLGRADVEAVEMRLALQQRRPGHDRIHFAQPQRLAPLPVGDAQPLDAQPRPPARPCPLDMVDRHR